MKIAEKHEVPDKCPDDCPFKGDPIALSQGGMCFRCPVLICKDDPEIGPLVEPEDYRPDWAEQWEKFFKKEIDFPQLRLDFQSWKEKNKEAGE